jgi:dTMP kinase
VGLLIAIEGIDGTGKGTQARRLTDTLAAQGRPVELIGFPRYRETEFGDRIGHYLDGRYGALADVHPLFASLLFAGDRFESRDMLLDALARCDIVILDRYVGSNLAHQCARQFGAERAELMDFIDHLEHGIYKLPQADLVILLDLPAEQAQELIAKKAPRDYTDQAHDLQEANVAYQESVRQLYLEIAASHEQWRRVDLAPDGTLRPIDDIAAEILQIVTAQVARSRS